VSTLVRQKCSGVIGVTELLHAFSPRPEMADEREHWGFYIWSYKSKSASSKIEAKVIGHLEQKNNLFTKFHTNVATIYDKF